MHAYGHNSAVPASTPFRASLFPCRGANPKTTGALVHRYQTDLCVFCGQQFTRQRLPPTERTNKTNKGVGRAKRTRKNVPEGKAKQSKPHTHKTQMRSLPSCLPSTADSSTTRVQNANTTEPVNKADKEASYPQPYARVRGSLAINGQEKRCPRTRDPGYMRMGTLDSGSGGSAEASPVSSQKPDPVSAGTRRSNLC